MFPQIPDERAEIESGADAVYRLDLELRELKAARNKIETTIIGLTPWSGYGIPLEIRETEYTYIRTGVVSSALDAGTIREAIESKTELFDLSLISSDEEQHYLAVVFYKESEEDVIGPLKRCGFSEMHFKDMAGTASENILCCEAELKSLAEKEAEIEKGLAGMAGAKEAIEVYYDCVTAEKERLEACDRILVTDSTFYFDGWVPAEESEKLASLLSEQGCFYEFRDPFDDEEPPVLLKNNKFISPVEVVTGLYALPNYREPDPTPVFALFYICFFGIMFADMGYGAILAVFAFAFTRAGRLEGNTFKFIRQLGYCGVSTFIWGAVFGSFFGNIVTVFSESFLGRSTILTPLWFDPVNNSMTMLAFSCIFGVIHIFAALGVKAYILIRKGRVLEAINDTFMWYVLVIGLALLLGGGMLPGDMLANAGDIGLYMTVIGAAGIIVLPVFYAKGVSKAAGLWKLYGIVSFLADVLSYARLLALCLAGSIVAQVFNMLAGMNANGAVGAILFFIIVIIAHIFNFLLSGLGCFVHAIRLQYVEFFGKFYEGNGIPFQPFMKNTKYVKVVKEGN
jgi:V/A-type H+-transporting ATPase subunit I